MTKTQGQVNDEYVKLQETCKGFLINAKDTSGNFKFLNDHKDGGFHSSDVHLRILLMLMKNDAEEKHLDDSNAVFTIIDTNDNSLAWTIKSLLEKGVIGSGGTAEVFDPSHTYWGERVKAYRLKTGLTIESVWDCSNGDFVLRQKEPIDKELVENYDRKFDPKKDPNKVYDNVQIVEVDDFESAMVMLSCCKFDVILVKDADTALFDFLRGDDDNMDGRFPSLNQMKDKGGIVISPEEKTRVIKEFRNAVKLNRGPLDKYWVLPIKEGFHKLLRENNIRTTDHRWNIGFGVDPEIHPWEFLYRLNEFIDLQLRLSVYKRETLITFLQYTIDDLKDRLRRRIYETDGSRKGITGTTLFFDGFQDFMGAEYSNFMKRYGARKLIERDAIKENDMSNKSLFATFVRDEFYGKFPIDTELNRLMQRFYGRAAIMYNDRYGRQRLRESFEALRSFVVFHGLSEGDKKMKDGLNFLRMVIDSEFYLHKVGEWMDYYR